MKHEFPFVNATLTMLPDNVRYPNRGRYMPHMPHIVLGDPTQREAIVGANNTIDELYLGICISDTPEELVPGRPTEVRSQLMYWPELRYDGVVPGATFTLREGPKIVGFGSVLSERQSSTQT